MQKSKENGSIKIYRTSDTTGGQGNESERASAKIPEKLASYKSKAPQKVMEEVLGKLSVF